MAETYEAVWSGTKEQEMLDKFGPRLDRKTA
jgi:hypothetical protein